jgi:hypothetical protein
MNPMFVDEAQGNKKVKKISYNNDCHKINIWI